MTFTLFMSTLYCIFCAVNLFWCQGIWRLTTLYWKQDVKNVSCFVFNIHFVSRTDTQQGRKSVKITTLTQNYVSWSLNYPFSPLLSFFTKPVGYYSKWDVNHQTKFTSSLSVLPSNFNQLLKSHSISTALTPPGHLAIVNYSFAQCYFGTCL